MNNLLDENTNLDDVNLEEADNQYWVNQRTALDSLKNKPYFKTLVEEGYFKDYVFELVQSLTDPNVIQEGRRNAILEKLVGVARFKEYLDMVMALSTSEEGYQEDSEKEYMEYKNKTVALVTALQEAERDKDFKLLVVDNYCNSYAASQTSLITNDQVVRNGHRTDVLESLSGISTLRNYIVDIHKNAASVAVDNSVEDEG